jgi:hypothetical protein
LPFPETAAGDAAQRPAAPPSSPGRRAIAILVAVVRRGDSGEIGDDVLGFRLRDHLLAFQDAAEQQPDDHQHDRDLYQGEALLEFLHGAPPQENLTGDYSASWRREMRLKISNFCSPVIKRTGE